MCVSSNGFDVFNGIVLGIMCVFLLSCVVEHVFFSHVVENGFCSRSNISLMFEHVLYKMCMFTRCL